MDALCWRLWVPNKLIMVVRVKSMPREKIIDEFLDIVMKFVMDSSGARD